MFAYAAGGFAAAGKHAAHPILLGDTAELALYADIPYVRGKSLEHANYLFECGTISGQAVGCEYAASPAGLWPSAAD